MEDALCWCILRMVARWSEMILLTKFCRFHRKHFHLVSNNFIAQVNDSCLFWYSKVLLKNESNKILTFWSESTILEYHYHLLSCWKRVHFKILFRIPHLSLLSPQWDQCPLNVAAFFFPVINRSLIRLIRRVTSYLPCLLVLLSSCDIPTTMNSYHYLTET